MPNNTSALATIIYKIATDEQWQEAEKEGSFTGSAVDIEDGYIHFSTKQTVIETARKHYKGQDDLWLIAISTKEMSDKLRFEPSRGGELFPHLYEPLDLSHVAWKKPLPLIDGEHQFPEMD
jgi:uncharacterized protein (DUF952 family)